MGWQKLHICPKVTKMGSIIGHKIDWGRGSERPAAHTQQKLNQKPIHTAVPPVVPASMLMLSVFDCLDPVYCNKGVKTVKSIFTRF